MQPSSATAFLPSDASATIWGGPSENTRLARERFEELVREHARVVAAAVRRVCGRRHQALIPDVEQEVYLALWRRLGGGSEIEFPLAYLYKMALTTALAMVRKHSRPGVSAPVEELAEREAPAAVGGLSAVERRRLLEEVLGALEPDDARALRGYLAGFSHTEVAELYGWSESVARHRIYRTIERLRDEAAGKGGARDGRRALGRG
jgi:RNA polymerase sigma factor (sigma-70 family)